MSAAAEDIAKKSRSNLAFALACLPPERREDMITFYAFCRVVDDLADNDSVPKDARRETLAQWRMAVTEGAGTGLQKEVYDLAAKHGFPTVWLAEIIDGVASDLDQDRYADMEALLGYCYKVASVVGLVSARIFGAAGHSCDEYAVKLGYAFQLTNIMRDVGQDAAETGRIYVPLDVMRKHGVTEQAILNCKREEGYTTLMNELYARADQYYTEARRALPRTERGAMIAARMMDAIYSQILVKLREGGYPSLERRERLSNGHKALILVRFLAEGWARRALDWLARD
ncbi:MAG: squalene/phytoene synthase family protein [Verrucomicrobiaceae bacterium]|nr:squalene/phytoene synthase family protein [Verrucomicrobiaceae bacterium]